MSSPDQGQERTFGQLVASASNDISTLVRGEIALAKAEIAQSAKIGGKGAALLAVAGVIAFYSVYFLFTTIVEGINEWLESRWLSYLIVTVFMLLLAGIFAMLGVKRLKKVKGPEKAIANAELTMATLKGNPPVAGTVTTPTTPVAKAAPDPAADRPTSSSNA